MRPYLLIVCLLTAGLVSRAQDPFTARWSFEGNPNGAASVLYITTSPAAFVGVAPANLGPYTTGHSGQAVNLDNWSTARCNRDEFVSVTLQPNRGQTMTLQQLSFYYARSASGPQQLSVRSSVDNFGSDLFTGTITQNPPYKQAVITLSGGAYANQSGPITFRIYGCPPEGAGTLRLDELVISGVLPQFPLPVSLIYFRAQPGPDNRVALTWATAWEHNAAHYDVQRGRSLETFSTIGQLPARGTNQTQQFYTFSDDWTDAGISYYRLRQVDKDGTATYSGVVAAVLDEVAPTLKLLESDQPGVLRVRGRNLREAIFSVFSASGQSVPVVVRAEPDGSFRIAGRLNPGLYVVQAIVGTTRLTQRALVW